MSDWEAEYDLCVEKERREMDIKMQKYKEECTQREERAKLEREEHAQRERERLIKLRKDFAYDHYGEDPFFKGGKEVMRHPRNGLLFYVSDLCESTNITRSALNWQLGGGSEYDEMWRLFDEVRERLKMDFIDDLDPHYQRKTI